MLFVLWLTSLKINPATLVQILVKALCISHRRPNTLRKGNYPCSYG